MTTNVSWCLGSLLKFNPSLMQIPRVDMDDSLAMREVFFGEGDGKNYIALCHTPATKGGQELPLSSVFIEASTEGSVKGEFVLVDCAHKLESGKTVAERFDLDLTKRPTIFVSGKVGSPKQVSLIKISSTLVLVIWICLITYQKILQRRSLLNT